LKFWIGITDSEWFSFLSQLNPDEINFWQPSGSGAFKALKPFELFLFKLHSPLNFIVGGGFFIEHSILPISLAWEAFERKNGAENFETFRGQVLKYRNQGTLIDSDPMIGCIILTQPFFFSRDAWIPVPSGWKSNIVRGKIYSTDDVVGLSLWADVQKRIEGFTKEEERLMSSDEQARYGAEYLARARLGQGTFRVLVTDVYRRRCAITGERTLPVLESAHIKPYALSGPHSINNGLLLRSDLHKLFDRGYITVTPEFHVEVSRRIKEEFENGHDYYAFQGSELVSLPEKPIYHPSRDYLQWHNENRFKV
jgi:putative restriction endonuclease